MRKRIFAVLMVMSLLIIGGLIYTQGISASHTVVSKVGVQVFRVADTNTPGGADSPDISDLITGASSKLKRTVDGISMEIKTSELPEGAYSIWWAIDNDNDDTTGASPGLPLVKGVDIVRRATGGIVGADGVGKFAATLPAAPVPPANMGATVMLSLLGNQPFDPMMARIGMVIRFHGPVIAGAVDEQTNLFAGGCSNTFLIGFVGAFPGPTDNICFDPQVTEFHVP